MTHVAEICKFRKMKLIYVKNSKFFFLSFLLCIGLNANGDDEIGFNAGEFTEKVVLSKALGGSSSGWFLPFHFTYSKDQNEFYQWTMDLVYRFDNHGSFKDYSEYLALFGVGYKFQPDLIGSLKVGGGFARGEHSGQTQGKNGGWVSGTYKCSELALQSSFQKRSDLGGHWLMGVGGGLLMILPTDCENEPKFSTIGTLVHRWVPILNLDLIYKF